MTLTTRRPLCPRCDQAHLVLEQNSDGALILACPGSCGWRSEPVGGRCAVLWRAGMFETGLAEAVA